MNPFQLAGYDPCGDCGESAFTTCDTCRTVHLCIDCYMERDGLCAECDEERGDSGRTKRIETPTESTEPNP
jgi:hypothetical protein